MLTQRKVGEYASAVADNPDEEVTEESESTTMEPYPAPWPDPETGTTVEPDGWSY